MNVDWIARACPPKLQRRRKRKDYIMDKLVVPVEE
jgi:hypothetical protein